MKRFDVIKTVQLILLALCTAAGLLIIFNNHELYSMIAGDRSIRMLALLLWVVLGISFAFLFYDFNSYADLRRENSELDHAVYSDALTGIANRYSVDLYIQRFAEGVIPADMGCVTLDLLNLSEINKAHGHAGGDAAIQAFSEILSNAAGGICFLGRNGGNKFVAIFRESTEKRIAGFLEAVETGINHYNEAHPDAAIKYHVGTALQQKEQAASLAELVALSDRRASA